MQYVVLNETAFLPINFLFFSGIFFLCLSFAWYIVYKIYTLVWQQMFEKEQTNEQNLFNCLIVDNISIRAGQISLHEIKRKNVEFLLNFVLSQCHMVLILNTRNISEDWQADFDPIIVFCILSYHTVK